MGGAGKAICTHQAKRRQALSHLLIKLLWRGAHIMMPIMIYIKIDTHTKRDACTL